ncbi:MAG: rRNA maturation RNase YbeY [Oscillospiraceae bacterium]|nr:rRNA maturation RNase YbeY [Oscillospiraceae bacterium]
MRHRIYITRRKRTLGHPETADLVKKAARTALRCEGIDEPCEISVTLTDDAGIHAINREFRGVDAPTDVLSFPIDEPDPETGCRFLGDMVLDLERVVSQAEEYGGGYAHEAQYLTVHSVLHLLGYDHLDEGEEKARMREREKAIMKELGYDF